VRPLAAFASFVVLFGLLASSARAENRSLLLTDHATQATSDIDFTLLPIWHALNKCPEHTVTDSCRLERMTENPAGTARSEIIGTALRLAQLIDGGRSDDPDGFYSLRAAQAYLVAAAYEAELERVDEARAHYALAAARAGEVPRTLEHFGRTVSVQNQNMNARTDNVSPSASMPTRVTIGTKSTEQAILFYSEAQLVREYATRALAELNPR
jgi:hypothetical protein